jgi:hypothetical protein
MSAKQMGRVWDLELPNAQQSVLLALADHAEHDGTKVYPSVGRIAWKTGYSCRQVKRIIATLREAGLIEVLAEARRHRPTEYQLRLDAGRMKPPYRPAAGEDDQPAQGCHLDTPSGEVRGAISTPVGVPFGASRGAIAVSPEPSLNRQGNHQPPLAPPAEQGGNERSDPPEEGNGRALELWGQIVDGAPEQGRMMLRTLAADVEDGRLVLAGRAADFCGRRYANALAPTAAELGVVLDFRPAANPPPGRERRPRQPRPSRRAA